jgi:hypothetical protein
MCGRALGRWEVAVAGRVPGDVPQQRPEGEGDRLFPTFTEELDVRVWEFDELAFGRLPSTLVACWIRSDLELERSNG